MNLFDLNCLCCRGSAAFYTTMLFRFSVFLFCCVHSGRFRPITQVAPAVLLVDVRPQVFASGSIYQSLLSIWSDS